MGCGDRLAGRLPGMLPPRIDKHAVLSETVIEMRTSCRARRTDSSDELSLIDMRAGTNALGKRRQVQVIALESARMANANLASTPTCPSCGYDDAACHGDHGCAGRRPVPGEHPLVEGSD